ncbi:MAG: DUF2298 domain-containing protein, partial [Halobacteriaceae archaeon]
MELVLVLRWLILIGSFWILGLPIARKLFPEFPDGGASLALHVSLILIFVPAYWVGRFHVNLGYLVGVVVLLVATAYSIRSVSLPTTREIAAPLGIFIIVFAIMLIVRGGYPWIVPAGGEKFLDFSLLKAVTRADTLPPEDPWFAGRAVRYYYGGYLISGGLTEISGIDAAYTYNLLLPTFFSMLATGAYGLAAAIANKIGYSSFRSGVMASFFVAFSGNLATPARFLLGLAPNHLARQYGHAILTGIRAEYTDMLVKATNPD